MTLNRDCTKNSSQFHLKLGVSIGFYKNWKNSVTISQYSCKWGNVSTTKIQDIEVLLGD